MYAPQRLIIIGQCGFSFLLDLTTLKCQHPLRAVRAVLALLILQRTLAVPTMSWPGTFWF
jgi:hypothetical protein